MLDMMRRQSYLIYVVFGGIILIFAFNFGPASSGCRGSADRSWAVKVDGEPIAQRTFANLYVQQLQYIKQLAERSGQAFDPAMAERLGLPKRVLDQVVEHHLLAKQAEAQGILVSDDELRQYLDERYGAREVKYDAYENWVTRSFDTTVARFESEARAEVAAQRLGRLISEVVSVSDDELHAAYDRAHDRARFVYARFTPDSEAVPAPPAAAVDKALAEQNAALEAHYNKTIDLYRTPPQLHLRQVVVRVPRALDEDEEDKALAAAEQILAQARQRIGAGEDFAKVSAELSTDADVAKRGGDMGPASVQELGRPFVEATAQLKEGELSAKTVRSPMGLHLLQLLGRKEATSRDFASVRAEVAQSYLRGQAAAARAQKQAEQLHRQLRAGGRWEALTRDASLAQLRGSKFAAARAHGVLRQQSGWSDMTTVEVAGLGRVPPLRAALFAPQLSRADRAVLPQVYEVEGSFYVAGQVERERPQAEEFLAQIESQRDEALEAKRGRVLGAWLAHLRGRSKVQNNPAVFGIANAAG